MCVAQIKILFSTWDADAKYNS